MPVQHFLVLLLLSIANLRVCLDDVIDDVIHLQKIPLSVSCTLARCTGAAVPVVIIHVIILPVRRYQIGIVVVFPSIPVDSCDHANDIALM